MILLLFLRLGSIEPTMIAAKLQLYTPPPGELELLSE